ncbi:DNA-directed DNA polymerase, partial [Tanacetum coccineum]
MSHPYPKRNFVPKAVLMKYGFKTLNTVRQNSSRTKLSVNTARPINTAYPRPTVNCARPVSNVFNRAHSHVRRPLNKFTTNKNSNFNEKVNIVKGNVTTAGPKAVVSNNRGNEANVVKASTCWIWRPKHKVLDHGNPQQDMKDKGVIDSRCSRHMTWNRSYLTDYEYIDGGFAAFGGSTKGGKITRKGKIRTGKLDFKDVYFVKELNFKLFSVSQMCDKKSSVLFTNTECIVLSLDFKRSHLSLCKTTSDESNLCHRRLGHVNFKTINKLVKRNLVRSLPSKRFEINQTYVACQKGKQHRASWKTKIVSLISQPLQMLHMDLFGPTFIKSLMKKMYCLVVTNDYSRFSWVFFLATKDETSEILKTFITNIENLIDLKVKVIRCDNGIEFKNKVMNQLCEMKDIKREFSVAGLHNQLELRNGIIATLNRGCRDYASAFKIAQQLSGMKCPVTILNTIDHLCKFNRKANEGFFVGYSTNSKAFRVFNSRTRIVEENLHVKLSEDTPNIALTKSIKYEPVVAVNQSNGNAGTKACDGSGKARMETVPGKDYIMLPFLIQDPSFSFSSKDSLDARFKPSREEEKKDYEDPRNKDSKVPNTEKPRVNQEKDVNDDSNDDEDVGAKADMTNLDTHILVSPISTTRIHKDHPVEQIIEDIHSAPQTRRMKKSVTDHVEPNKKVWILVDLPYGKRAIRTKWVYRNKKDERGIVLRNKARLVAQGYTQEEEIDYDEVFAPVARIEVIRLFLAYASFKDFVVYQIDVTNAFLYGKIEEEVYYDNRDLS